MLPALALVFVGLLVASTATPAATQRETAPAAEAKAPSAKPAASPSANVAPTSGQQSIAVLTITPLPFRASTPTAASKQSRIGETIRVGDYSLTVLDIRNPAESPYLLVQPTQGNKYVAAQVRIANQSNRNAAFSYLHFRLRDIAGAETRATAATAAEPAIATGDLAPREITTGWVTFLIRSDTAVESLIYQPPGALGPRGQVSLL